LRFDDLDRVMRVYETAHDHCVLPGLWMVARLDGRNFTRLTRERHPFERPFDVRFRDMMLDTTEHLMSCGFRIIYAYAESDEISLLFHPQEEAFGRKLRKLDSILAGEASARFSLLLGDIACFDCRISQLPSTALVVDYFRWRSEDAHRNALNGHCFWRLVDEGDSPKQAAVRLERMSIAAKNELLFQRGVNFNDLPAWQRRGAGLTWERSEHAGANRNTGDAVTYTRRSIHRDLELPMKDAYGAFLRRLLAHAESEDG
jgi:tRNA(His) 5'-end guanylyltransferase